jgi:hypothetical protein
MKTLLTLALLILFTPFSYAQILPFNYTGNEVAKPNDTPLLGNVYQTIGLGGTVGNDFITEKAFEFTVDQVTSISDLVVNADVTDGQSIDVSFDLFKGTKPLFMGEGYAPDSLMLSSDTYNFQAGTYKNFEIPFSSELDPNTDYWIMAQDPQFSGTTFNYTTNYIDPPIAPVPELCTWILFMEGLFLILPLVLLRRNFMFAHPSQIIQYVLQLLGR